MPDAASSETIEAKPGFVLVETGIEAAWAALDAGDLSGALAAFATLREMFPQAIEPYRQAASVLTDHHNFDEADILLEVATERFPDDAALAADFARAAQHRGDMSASLRRWEQARGAFADDPAIAIGAAVALRDAGRFGAAEALLRSAPDPVALLERARIALARRDLLSAIRLWKAARDRLPTRTEGWTGGAEALREAGRFAEADALLTEAFARFPDAAEPSIEYARLATARRDWPEASRRWSIVRDRHPDNVDGFTGQAGIWREMGQFDSADAVLTEALVRFPDDLHLLTAYAEVSQAKPDWAEAVARWEHIRILLPGHANAYVRGIVALREAGRGREAEGLAIEAQRRFRAHPEPELEYAHLAQARRDWPTANTRWERAKVRFPDSVEAYLGSAQCLREQGDVGQADAVLRLAATRFPDRPEPLRARAELATPEDAASISEALQSRFPWLFASVTDEAATEPLALPAVGRAGPIRLAVTGFHLAHQISMLFSRTLPFRGKLSVEWINAGMEIGAIRSRMPEAVDLYFEEAAAGNAATRRGIRDLLPASADVRTFPTSTLRCLWPFQGRDARLVPEPPVYNGGRYVDTDGIAASLVNPVITDDALFDLYMELTEAAPLDLDALLAADFARFAAEDQDLDVKLAPFVETHFRDEMLFAASHERCTPIVVEIARQLLATPVLGDICDLDTALAGLDGLTLGWRAHGRACPIHPRIARHFGLTWWSPDMTYDLGHNSFTYRDYMIRYMRWSPWLG